MTSAGESFRDSTAVAGVGLTIGHFPDKTPLSVAVEAFQLALADSGLERKDVDGLVCLSCTRSFGANELAHGGAHHCGQFGIHLGWPLG